MGSNLLLQNLYLIAPNILRQTGKLTNNESTIILYEQTPLGASMLVGKLCPKSRHSNHEYWQLTTLTALKHQTSSIQQQQNSFATYRSNSQFIQIQTLQYITLRKLKNITKFTSQDIWFCPYCPILMQFGLEATHLAHLILENADIKSHVYTICLNLLKYYFCSAPILLVFITGNIQSIQLISLYFG